MKFLIIILGLVSFCCNNIHQEIKNDVSTRINFYPNGFMKDSLNYTNNLPNDFSYGYDSSGELSIKNYFYYGLLMGPHYSFKHGKIVEYSFTDFDKNTVLYTKYDSTGKCIIYENHVEPILTESLDSNRTFVLVVRLFFPKPPNFKTTYSLGLANNLKQEKGEKIIFSERVFLDTILEYPEKGWNYYVKSHFENISDTINKVYIQDLKTK